VITEFQPGTVRWDADRPVAVGDQELSVPTRTARTGAGFWGIYGTGEEVVVVHPAGAFGGPAAEVGSRLRQLATDEDGDAADRDVAAAFAHLLGGDDPGADGDVPRSRVESDGPPPTYRLSDPTNSPPEAASPDSGPG
jgi:hypothetical protein